MHTDGRQDIPARSQAAVCMPVAPDFAAASWRREYKPVGQRGEGSGYREAQGAVSDTPSGRALRAAHCRGSVRGVRPEGTERVRAYAGVGGTQGRSVQVVRKRSRPLLLPARCVARRAADAAARWVIA